MKLPHRFNTKEVKETMLKLVSNAGATGLTVNVAAELVNKGHAPETRIDERYVSEILRFLAERRLIGVVRTGNSYTYMERQFVPEGASGLRNTRKADGVTAKAKKNGLSLPHGTLALVQVGSKVLEFDSFVDLRDFVLSVEAFAQSQ